MDQQLRALAALAEDLSSVPSTSITPVPGDGMASVGLPGVPALMCTELHVYSI